MAASNFEVCLALTLQFEGGYSDHPADPGGATKLGVTRRTLAAFRGRAVSKADVRHLSLKEAAVIYRGNYWDAVRGDELPVGIDAVMFDHAVNSGPRAAIIVIQKALGLTADGKFGPATMTAVKQTQPHIMIGDLIRRRRSFLARLKTFRIFGRGWSRRIRAIETASLAMAERSKVAMP